MYFHFLFFLFSLFTSVLTARKGYDALEGFFKKGDSEIVHQTGFIGECQRG